MVEVFSVWEEKNINILYAERIIIYEAEFNYFAMSL